MSNAKGVSQQSKISSDLLLCNLMENDVGEAALAVGRPSQCRILIWNCQFYFSTHHDNARNACGRTECDSWDAEPASVCLFHSFSIRNGENKFVRIIDSFAACGHILCPILAEQLRARIKCTLHTYQSGRYTATTKSSPTLVEDPKTAEKSVSIAAATTSFIHTQRWPLLWHVLITHTHCTLIDT